MTQPKNPCPTCRTATRPVGSVTLTSLLKQDSARGLQAGDGYRFCRDADCPTVYSHPDTNEVFRQDDLKVPVFQKSADPARPVCYCFDHSVADVRADARKNGKSLIADDITELCRKGLDRCDENNPQGACCLGNVRQVAKDALGQPTEATEEAEACCSGDVCEDPAQPAVAVDESANPAAIWTASGAVVVATLSSACCWLPLLLVSVGASAVGVSAFFEAYRLHLLVAAGLLLSGGFYAVYLRRPECGPDGVCLTPNPKLQRFNRVSLWVAASLVVLLAVFPDYVGALGGDGSAGPGQGQGPSESQPDHGTAFSDAKEARTVLRIEGMTCGGCAGTTKKALQALDGVTSADVNYDKRCVRVVYDPKRVTTAQMVAAVEKAGYGAKVDPKACEQSASTSRADAMEDAP